MTWRSMCSNEELSDRRHVHLSRFVHSRYPHKLGGCVALLPRATPHAALLKAAASIAVGGGSLTGGEADATTDIAW